MFVKEFVKTIMIVRVVGCNLYFLRSINKKVTTLYLFNEKEKNRKILFVHMVSEP